MLVRDLAEQIKLEAARIQPNLHFTRFSPLGLLNAVRREHFQGLGHAVELYFVNRGPLACVMARPDRATIYIHQVLNHAETPIEVLSLVCKHELLHLEVPPVTVKGRTLDHPPEFWAREKAVTPERRAAWAWIWRNYARCLQLRRRLERIDVTSRWRRLWSLPRIDLRACMGDGAGAPDLETVKGW